MTNLDTVAWDRELLDLFGLADEPLPTIVSCDATVGTTTVFGGTVAVGGLVVDQQAALIGEGCLRPGEAKCTFGTGAFLLANTGTTATRSSAGLAASVGWQVRDETTYCVDGQVYTAASAVRWMEQLGYITTAADMDDVAAADAGGVLAVPALAGWARPGGAPKQRPPSRG
jgi:glycerol kinase